MDLLTWVGAWRLGRRIGHKKVITINSIKWNPGIYSKHLIDGPVICTPALGIVINLYASYDRSIGQNFYPKALISMHPHLGLNLGMNVALETEIPWPADQRERARPLTDVRLAQVVRGRGKMSDFRGRRRSGWSS